MRRGTRVALAVLVVLVAGPLPLRAGSRLARASSNRLGHLLSPAPGRARIIHLWASWCLPCVAEWPTLGASLRQWSGRPIDVVTVALDDDDTARAAERVLRSAGELPGLHLRAPAGDVFPAVRALVPDWDGALPTTLLLDARGQVVTKQVGLTRLGLLGTEVERVLAKAPSRETLEP